MPKTLSCRDVGVDCDFVATGENEAEIMTKAVEHARAEHGYDEIPPDLAERARAAIKEVQAAP